MSSAIHIVLDNNLPLTVVQELGIFWGSTFPQWTVRHESSVAKRSSPDSHWIAKLSTIEPEGHWVLFTRDAGINTSKESEKLPKLCKHHGHAYVILSAALQKAETLKAAFSSIWPDIPKVVQACEKLKHRPKMHVRLCQTKEREKIGYLLHVRQVDLGKFLMSVE